MLRLNGESFASGFSRFRDHGSDALEPTAKVFVKVDFSDLDTTLLAQLDTGAAYSTLETHVAEALDLLDGNGQQVTIDTRLGSCHGRLERVPITLVADEGEALDIEAVFFVSKEWLGKTFLGYTGLLNHIRMALDPGNNHFYFGRLE
jgi:hypothetical protein